MKKKQKDIFLEQEGDNFFDRNNVTIEKREMGINDPIVNALSNLIDKYEKNSMSLLEIGCGEGKRLRWISENYNIRCYGIDPSKKAVEKANTKNISVSQGTADDLKFENEKFDFVIFGFCLYLCDRSDLFQIAKEADRVLKKSGYVIIRDFFSSNQEKKIYKYNENLFSYKMDYRKLFQWHPNYECIYHKVGPVLDTVSIDDKNEWRATSVIRKNFIDE